MLPGLQVNMLFVANTRRFYDHAHYKSPRRDMATVFCDVSQIRYTSLAEFFFTDNSYSCYLRGLCCEMATNEHLVSVPPVKLSQTGNYDLTIRLVTLFWQSFAI